MPDSQPHVDVLPANILWTRRGICAVMLLLFFVLVPVLNTAGVVPDYKISVLGKYLCLAIVAIGIDLIWGYTGILSLCQAFFFCLGGYAMAMHLSLPQGGGDVRPEYNNIPQFMFFNNLHELPSFWKPFGSLIFTLFAGLGLPALAATIFGFFILRSRVRGVYFSIITQAVAWGAWLLISRNEMLLGGTNGLTNFNKAFTQDHKWILSLYLLTITMLTAVYLLCKAISRSRLGRLLVAVRDKETRLYFAGYRPYAFKVFAFAVAAMLAGLGGMLYAPQVGIITPQNMNVQASIDMVILVAVGGRGRLWGAVLGALLVNYTYACLTSDMPAAWPFVQGAMFLAVVLLFPDGIVTLWDSVEKQITSRAGTLRIAMTALPLVVIVVFLAAESLGLMPDALQRVVFESDKIGRVALKYFLLIGLLIIAAMWQAFSKPRAAAVMESIDLSLATEEVQP